MYKIVLDGQGIEYDGYSNLQKAIKMAFKQQSKKYDVVIYKTNNPVVTIHKIVDTPIVECPDSPTGLHVFSIDWDHDISGDTVNCEFCGLLSP